MDEEGHYLINSRTKCDLIKESLEIRMNYEEFDSVNVWDQIGDDMESGDEVPSLFAQMVRLKKKFCKTIGCIEYQIKFDVTYFHESDNLELYLWADFDSLEHVTNLKIKEIYLKIQDGVERHGKIGVLHTKVFPRVKIEGNSWKCLFKGADSHNLDGFEWEQDMISGWFVCSFETTKLLQNFREIKTMSIKRSVTWKPPTIDFDFEITAKRTEKSQESKPVKFHKCYLGQVSEVFQRMFEHPETIECQTGKLKCKGFSLGTIEKFHKLLYKQNLEERHINIDLMKFADKYMVNDLYNFCSEHFMDHVSENNLIELIKIGTLKNDDSLLDGCAGYIRKNHYRSFFKSEDWKNFKAENPECMLKIGNAM